MLDVVSSLPRSLSSTSVVGVGVIFIIYILDIIIKFQRDVIYNGHCYYSRVFNNSYIYISVK